MDYYKLLLGLILLCLIRKASVQHPQFAIDQQDQMAEIEWTKEDFLNGYPDIISERTISEEIDAEDNLVCAAIVIMAITAVFIFAGIILVAVLFWNIRSQMKTMVNVYNTINEIQSRGLTGSLSTSTVRSESSIDYIQISSAGNPPEFETESTSVPPQSTSHQNILHGHTYVAIADVETDYLTPTTRKPTYDELQHPPLELSILQSRNSFSPPGFSTFRQGDVPNVIALDPKFNGRSDLESLEIP